jgi:hypothetical protein
LDLSTLRLLARALISEEPLVLFGRDALFKNARNGAVAHLKLFGQRRNSNPRLAVQLKQAVAIAVGEFGSGHRVVF